MRLLRRREESDQSGLHARCRATIDAMAAQLDRYLEGIQAEAAKHAAQMPPPQGFVPAEWMPGHGHDLIEFSCTECLKRWPCPTLNSLREIVDIALGRQFAPYEPLVLRKQSIEPPA